MIKLNDPSGVATEVCCGALVKAEQPFHSPRAMGGFEATGLGLGHIVLAVDDCETSLRFYRNGLGLMMSDFIELDMGPAGHTTLAFLHCGPRHHSIAVAQFQAPKRPHHFMLQVRQLNDIGTTFDLCLGERVPITSGLGCYTNDHMVSLHSQTPSGFQVEYGHGGREIDDDTWQVQGHHVASIWGTPSARCRAVGRNGACALTRVRELGAMVLPAHRIGVSQVVARTQLTALIDRRTMPQTGSQRFAPRLFARSRLRIH